jgi:hypothetical protein
VDRPIPAFFGLSLHFLHLLLHFLHPLGVLGHHSLPKSGRPPSVGGEVSCCQSDWPCRHSGWLRIRDAFCVCDWEYAAGTATSASTPTIADTRVRHFTVGRRIGIPPEQTLLLPILAKTDLL